MTDNQRVRHNLWFRASVLFHLLMHFIVSIRYTITCLIPGIFNLFTLSDGHMMVSGDEKVQTNKCLFIKAWPVCDLTVCQKSIYLAEQGGRSQPGLKNWVSGRLSPSALSQLGMRVLHHPTCTVTSAGHTGGKSNGMSCTPQVPSLWRNQACFGFTSRINCT